jgi:hypothetical protein
MSYIKDIYYLLTDGTVKTQIVDDSDNQLLSFDSDKNLYVNGGLVSPSSLGDGRQTVTSAGTATKLITASTPCTQVLVTALRGNTGVIEVGSSTVVAADGSQRGTPLNALDSIRVDIDDVSKVYIDSTISGEGVAFFYEG